MITLLLILLIVAVTLAVILFVGGLFLQGYFYTVPSDGLRWQAPATGFLLAGFLLAWCLLVLGSGTTGPQDIPYDTIFRFSPRVDMVQTPVPSLTASRKDKSAVTEVIYVRKRLNQNTYVYKEEKGAQRPWNGQGVVAITFMHDKEKYRLEAVKTETGGYRQFVDPNTGWAMTEYDDGPTGIPTAFRWGRFLTNLFLNVLHLGLWFVGLWLLMRFQWGHALLLALAAWLLMTLAILPMLLGYAAEVAVKTG